MASSSIKVLVVESDISRSETIGGFLASTSELLIGFEKARTLAIGLKLFEEDQWDVVVTSLNLSDANGLGALVRFHPTRRDTPVIAIVQDEEHDSVVAAAQSLADDCLYWGDLTIDTMRQSIAYALERREMLRELSDQRPVLATNISKAPYRDLMDHLDHAVFLVSRDDRSLLFANRLAQKWFGSELNSALLDWFEYGLLDCTEVEMEVATRSSWVAYGSLKSVDVAWRGKPACLVTLRDISRQKRAEEAYIASRLSLELALKSTAVGLWTWDLRSNELTFNASWKAILGYEEHEFPDTVAAFRKALHPDDRAEVMGVFKAFLRESWVDFKLKHRIRGKGGEYSIVLSRAELLSDAEGRLSKMIGSMTKLEQDRQTLEEWDKAAMAQTETESIGEFVTGNPLERRKALIADDEEVLRMVLNSILLSRGFETIIARDGQEAIELYEKNKDNIAIALIDMNMPHRDGSDVYHRIRSDGLNIPILVMSGNDDKQAIPFEDGEKENSEFVMKPFGVGEIKVSMDRLLGNAYELAGQISN